MFQETILVVVPHTFSSYIKKFNVSSDTNASIAFCAVVTKKLLKLEYLFYKNRFAIFVIAMEIS